MPSSCVGFRVVSSFSVCEERVFVVGVIFQKMSVCVSQSVDVVFFPVVLSGACLKSYGDQLRLRWLVV